MNGTSVDMDAHVVWLTVQRNIATWLYYETDAARQRSIAGYRELYDSYDEVRKTLRKSAKSELASLTAAKDYAEDAHRLWREAFEEVADCIARQRDRVEPLTRPLTHGRSPAKPIDLDE